MKPSNKIKCEFHSKIDSTIKLKYDSNVNSIQRQIQPLNPQIGQFHSKTDSTIKPTNEIRQFQSKTELTIKH